MQAKCPHISLNFLRGKKIHRIEKDDNVSILKVNLVNLDDFLKYLTYIDIIQVFLYLVDKQISKCICKLGKLNLNLLNYLG